MPWLVGGLSLLVAGAPLTVNAFGAEYRAGFQLLSLGLGLVALSDPRRAEVLFLGRPRSVVIPLVTLWIYFLARVPSTLDPPAALAQVLDRTALGTVIVILASGVIGEGRRAVIRAGLLGMAVVAAWGIAQRAGVHPFLDPSIWRPSRPTRPLGTHNLMGAYLAAWLPVAAALALVASGWRKVGWGAVALLGLACLLLSESRGAWLALAMAMVAMGPWLWRGGAGQIATAWRHDRRGNWILVLAAFAVTAACAGSVLTRLGTPEQSGLLAAGAPVADRFERAPAARAETAAHAGPAAHAEPAGASGAKALTSFERRALVARTAVDLVAERPLAGFGPGSFRLAFYTARPPLMQRLEAETGETAVHAHSDPLEIAAELGLAGLALVVVWLALAAWRAFRAIDPRSVAVPAGGSPRARAKTAGDALVDAGLVAGGMALGIHALVDFPLHEAPTALVGAVFLGFAAGERVAPSAAPSRSGRRAGALLAMRLGVSAILIAGIAGAVAVAAADRAYRRAYAVLSNGDLAGSERWLERARRLVPDQARDWVAWGEVARHEARLATSAGGRASALRASAARFDEAARREPQIASRWLRAATALDEARAAGAGASASASASVDSVRAFLDRALALNPYLGRARARRIALAREEGDWAGGAAALAAGDSLTAGDPGLALERGRLLGMRGDASGALVEFEKAARGESRETAGLALDEMAALAAAPGESERTGAAPPVADPVGRLESLARDAGLDLAVRAGAARLRGDVAVATGDLEGARAWYAEAAAASPGSPEVEFGLGNVAYASGDLAAAERHYRSALGGRPEMAGAWQNLGHVAIARGDTAGALRFYGRALAQQPANAPLRAYVEQITGRGGDEGQR